MRKIITAIGARPNFIKVAPLHREFKNHPDILHRIVHTGQHYDDNMSKVFFTHLELPHADINLGIGSGSHAEQTGRIMIEFEKVVIVDEPDVVIVVGDVNSTIACSLVCAKLLIPVAHVEAGLRSFDRTMPEEYNRMLTDSISDFLFVTEPAGVENLFREGIDKKKVFLVGDVMIDSLIHYREKARASSILRELGVESKRYAVATLHRPSNVDVRENLQTILKVLEAIGGQGKIVFPIHPRTRKMLEQFRLLDYAKRIPGLLLVDPIGYLDFLCLMDHAAVVLTDSGGIQEETTFLGVPCLTMRKATERPITIEQGTNELVGLDAEKIVQKCLDAFDGRWKNGRIPELWDGKTAERIVTILKEHLN